MTRIFTFAVTALLSLCVLLLSQSPALRPGGADRLAFAAVQRRLARRAASGAGCGFPPAPLAAVRNVTGAPLVLVTGGAGYVGSHVVHRLLLAGYAVRVLDDLSTGRMEDLPLGHPRLAVVVGDVGNASACAAAAAGASAVLHLAAFSRVLPSLEGGPGAAAACARTNVEGTLRVLEAAHEAGATRFVYAGSSTAYGGGADEGGGGDDGAAGWEGAGGVAAAATYGGGVLSAPLLPSWEGDRPAPTTPYAATKLAGELMANTYGALALC